MKRTISIIASLIILSSLVACNDFSPISELKAVSNGHFTSEQLNYLKNENYADTTPYNGNMSMSKPLPVSLSWKAGKGQYHITLTGSSSGDSAKYMIRDKKLDFYNPIIGETYEASLAYRQYNEVVSFKEEVTVPGPRNIYLDGVENVRDIGGWGKFVDSKYQTYMKQGFLYRSGRFNEDKAEEVKVTITNEGLDEIKNHLKFKTEVDLRKTSTNEVGGLTKKSVLGDDVKYVQLPMAYNGNNILTFKGKVSGDTYEYDNPSMIKQFFELLANKDNYPINYHCSIGKDRTGCLSYLIEGLVGFDQETMYRDYMFTNFADAGLCKLTDVTERYGKTINEYENGATLQEKVYNYLNEVIGVSKENLDNIITILKA